MNSATGVPARAGQRQWWGLGVPALPTLLLSLDMSVLYLALPHLAAAGYRTGVTVPQDAPEQAGHTLAGAVTAAENLPGNTAGPLLDSAREAFTFGLNITAGVGLAVMVVFGVLALVLLREAPTTHDEKTERADEFTAATGSVLTERSTTDTRRKS